MPRNLLPGRRNDDGELGIFRRFVQSDGMGGESYSSSSSSLSNESGSRRKEPGFSTCKCADKVDDSRLKRLVAAAPWFLRSSSRPLDMGDVATVPLDGGRGDVVSMGEAPADAWPSINTEYSVAGPSRDDSDEYAVGEAMLVAELWLVSKSEASRVASCAGRGDREECGWSSGHVGKL